MVDRITSDRVVEITNGYAIDFELPNGEPARLVGKCKERLMKTAQALYISKQLPNDSKSSQIDGT